MKTILCSLVNRWGQREPAIVVSVASIIAAALVLIVSVATIQDNYTIFGPGLGADFPQFYGAGKIILEGRADRLYDLQLQQQYYHQILPNEGKESYLPYVYPPFFAILFIPLSLVPSQYYFCSFLAWGFILLAFYVSGVRLLFRTLATFDATSRSLAMLLALAFPPFLMESLLTGQTSPFGFFAFSLTLFLQHRGLPMLSGLALSLCSYKPPLLILILPMLVVGRQWRILCGFVVGCAMLVLVSIAIVGLDSFLAYVKFLLSYTTLTKEGFRTYKYVDIASFTRLLLNTTSRIPSYLGYAGILAGLGLLSRQWFHVTSYGHRHAQMLWSNTLAWTLVLNIYVGIYEVTMLVIPLMYIVDEGRQSTAADHQTVDQQSLSDSIRAQLMVVLISCWLTQFVALVIGVQVLTLVILWVAASQRSSIIRST